MGNKSSKKKEFSRAPEARRRDDNDRPARSPVTDKRSRSSPSRSYHRSSITSRSASGQIASTSSSSVPSSSAASPATSSPMRASRSNTASLNSQENHASQMANERFPCSYWYNIGWCRDGANCQYSHGPGDDLFLRYDESGRRPCPYFLAGACPLGDRCPDVHNEDDSPHRRLAASALSPASTAKRRIAEVSLASRTFRYDDAAQEAVLEPECTLCLEVYDHDSELRMLKCRHTFHLACVDEWLLKSTVCPICNGVVTAPQDDQLNNSKSSSSASASD